MYLEHFNIREFPFSITPNTDFYCELPSHQAALNTLLVSLRSGEGFIKIIGEVGTGKTLLCRLLLQHLTDPYVTAYIPNPDLGANDLRKAIARELGVQFKPNVDQHTLLELINLRLLQLHAEGKQVVLLIDEAQALPTESIETVRLLTNIETESAKLLQVILFGQPELDKKLKSPELRQLKQRITFSYALLPLQPKELDVYLNHRLAKAGYTYGNLFSSRAKGLLYRNSRGLPRLINILCHKAMMFAYGRGDATISRGAMLRAIKDTEDAQSNRTSSRYLSSALWLSATIGLCTAIAIVTLRIVQHHYTA